MLSLISLHLTGTVAAVVVVDDEADVDETGFKLVSDVVILIFFTVPNPGVGAKPEVGVELEDVDVAKQGRVGERLESGESALELDLELSDESLDEEGLILRRSPPSMRKCWSRIELQVWRRLASFVE